MSPSTNLYRRTSGIYVVRISIPLRFRRYAGQCEIHTSTGSYHLSDAKLRASKLLAVWHQVLIEYQRLDAQSLNAAAPLTAGAGMISLDSFSRLVELPHSLLIQAVIDRNIPTYWMAVEKSGYYIESLDDLERDPLSGGFILNSAISVGIEGIVNGLLQPNNQKHTLANLLNGVSSEDEAVFVRPGKGKKGLWFFDFPAVSITAENLLIHKVHAEGLRISWLARSAAASMPSIEPEALELKAASKNTASALPLRPPEVFNEYVRPKFYTRNLTWLCNSFIAHSMKAKPRESKIQGYRDYFSFLIEVMGDEKLANVDRDFFKRFEERLRLIPANRNLVKIKYRVESINDLIDVSAANKEPLMTEMSVRKYLNGIFGPIRWAVSDEIFTRSPCEGLLPDIEKKEMDQEAADPFNEQRLKDIFSLPIYSNGTGIRNRRGRFNQYRPFNYWAPLIALYTGARVNEISQLILDDVQMCDGIFYFNIENDDEHGKKLKTRNARRKIPIHSKLIDLGLIKYVEALKREKHTRLFPEIKPHETRGYGRPVSRWFNETIMYKLFHVPRDGKQSFHSFRHTISTVLKAEGVSPEIRAQIVGHIRGETETTGRYSKDLQPIQLKPYIEKLAFNLPDIAHFNIADGVDAVNDALRMKRDVK